MNDEQVRFRAQVDALRRIGYLEQYQGMWRRMCAPFWWSSKDEGKAPEICGNGTICFINTGDRHIGVTADHVYVGYLTDKRNKPAVECQFGSNTIDPETRLIDRNGLLDVATFDVPEVFVSASRGHYFHTPPEWPPKVLQERDVVVHGGYPQILRVPNTNQVTFPFQWFATRVNAVDAERVVLVPDAENTYTPDDPGGTVNVRWAGMSGGPVYRVRDAGVNGQLVDHVEIVGFIYQQYLDVVLARPASYIRAGGTIVPLVGGDGPAQT